MLEHVVHVDSKCHHNSVKEDVNWLAVLYLCHQLLERLLNAELGLGRALDEHLKFALAIEGQVGGAKGVAVPSP
jgi:hypothetical protein